MSSGAILPPGPHRLVVLGDPSTGKTTLCRRLQDPARVTDREWPSNQEYFHFERPIDEDNRADPSSVSSEAQTDSGPQPQPPPQRIKMQLVDQPGADRYSLQPIVFRKAVGALIVIDALQLYREFLADQPMEGTPSEGTRASLSTTQTSFAGDASSPGGSSRFFVPSGGVRWDIYLKQMILMWKTVVSDESMFCHERKKEKLPCVVVFTKSDMLPADDEQLVTSFQAQCKMACVGTDVHADLIVFIGLLHAPAEEVVALQDGIAAVMCRRLSVRERRRGSSGGVSARRPSVMLNEPPQQKSTKKTCCKS